MKNYTSHIDILLKWLIRKEVKGISIEYTSDNSIFITLITIKYNIYIEIFLNDDYTEIETICNIFDKNRKPEQIGFGSTLIKCLDYIDKKFNIDKNGK